MDDLIEALQIFKKHQTPTRWPTICQHDELIIVGVTGELPEEDRERLQELGFEYNEDEEYWSSCRFGSA